MTGWALVAVGSCMLAQESDLSGSMRVADGLSVEVWASAPMFFNPTSLDVDERGRLWVAEAVNYRSFNNRNEQGLWHEAGDRIMILEDRDQDGRADHSKLFVQDPDLVAPLGVSVIGDRVVVSCSPHLIVYTRDEADQVIDKQILLTGFGGFDHDHSLHQVEVGPDGRWYLNVGNAGPHIVSDRSGWTLRSGSWYTGGSPYNLENTPGLESDDGRVWTGGLMFAIEPDGTGMEVLGHGFRNAVGTCTDSFGELWMNDNDDTQSCRTSWLLRYGDCGYNSKDGRRSWQADRRPGQSIPTAHWRQADPGVIPSGHVYGNGAPTGIVYYENGALGPAYDGGLLLSCESGQNVIWAYRRQPRGAGYELEPFPLLTTNRKLDPDYQWNRVSADKAQWFRPSDIAVGTDGCLYVCDWFDPIVGGHLMHDRKGSGTIYRIRARDTKPIAPKEVAPGLEAALEWLASPATNVRQLGRERLLAAGEAAVAPLQWFAERNSNPFLKARALWMLAALGTEGEAALLRWQDDFDPEIRKLVYRARLQQGPLDVKTWKAWVQDPAPMVRREAALAFRERRATRDPELVPLMMALATGHTAGDRAYLEAFGLACEDEEEDMMAWLWEEMDPDPLQWSRAHTELAWRLHSELNVADWERRALARQLTVAERREAIDALAFTECEQAALAMVSVVESASPADRIYASWWLENRSKNAWKDYDLGESRPSRYPGEARFRSPLLHRGSVEIEVDITGASLLYLVADASEDGNAYDWVDWVDPILEGPDDEVSLTELEWVHAETGWGQIHRDRNCEGGPLILDGIEYAQGIGTHAPSVLIFDIGDLGFTTFRTRAGVDAMGSERAGSRTSLYLEVYHDGPNAWERVQQLQERMLDVEAEALERERAALALARSPQGGHLLLALAEEQGLADFLRETITSSIYRNPDLSVRALASRYFPRTGTAGDGLATEDEILRLPGSHDRGERLFFGVKTNCSSCHVYAGRGAAVGPDLSEIRTKFGERELLDAVLNPSAAVLAGYESQRITLEDGRQWIGFIVGDGERLTLKDSQGRLHELDKQQIASRQTYSGSIMPDNVAHDLTAEELADLLAFLQGKDRPDRR